MTQYLAIESNPKTRTMYKKYGIVAMPYEEFMKEGERNENC